jgi:hypothetical protein
VNDDEIEYLIKELTTALRIYGFDWVLDDLEVQISAGEGMSRRDLARALLSGLTAATVDLANFEASIRIGRGPVTFGGEVDFGGKEQQSRLELVTELQKLAPTILEMTRSIDGN